MKSRLRHGRRAILAMLLIAGSVCLVCRWSGNLVANRQRSVYEAQIAEVGLPIRPVYQFDYTATVCFAAGENKSVATSGCGATCLSMAIDYLTGEAGQSPQTLFEEAYANGDYFGSGLSYGALRRLAVAHGLSIECLARDEGQLRRALEQGNPVIAHMGPGQFADAGHYILLRGLTDDGRVVLNDPNSVENTYTAFDLSIILEQAKTDTPFLVCRTME